MKKKMITLLTAVFLCLSGCGTTYQEATGQAEANANDSYGSGYFTTITKWGSGYDYRIVYANDTKVKYLIIVGAYQYGITPLYNADGTLQVYEEGKAKRSVDWRSKQK